MTPNKWLVVATTRLLAPWLALVAAFGLSAASTHAQTPAAQPVVSSATPAFSAVSRPRIGLVLGGGGAKGFAHIGVIEELERRQIPIDVISGTSMGAVVGSMYAIGNDASEIKAIARGIDWATVFDDTLKREDLSFRRKREDRGILLDYRLGLQDGKPVLPKGVLGGQKLFATVQELLAPWSTTTDFDALPIPFRAVATNILTGQHVVMGQGNMATAVFASMSIPAAFAPVRRDGLLLVDGSISDNLPVDVARQMGVDVVIVVDVGSQPASSPDEINSALDVFGQMQMLLGWESIRRQRESIAGRDVLIEPDITDFSVTAFNELEMGIARGKDAAAKMGDKLAGLSVSDAQWAAYLAERKARISPQPIRIASVKIANTSKVETRYIEPLVTVRPGDTLDGPSMSRQVANIFALDEFERVDYDVLAGEGANALTINARGTRGATRYFQFGLALASDFGSESDFDLAVAYTDRDFLGTGAEWRGFARVGSNVLFDANLHKRFGRFFVEPNVFYERYTSVITQASSGGARTTLQLARAGIGFDAGLLFGNWGELRVGTRFGGVNPTEGDTGSTVASGWQRDVDWHIGFTHDTLDSLSFPTSGTFAQVQVTDHVSALGGTFDRSNLFVTVQQPLSVGPATVVLGGRMGTTTQQSVDLLGDFRLGGFLNLSGLTQNTLLGQQMLFGRAVGFYRLSDKAPILDMPIFVGGSFEVGNVWESRSDISLGNLRTAASGFVAANTLIGPVWLAVGQSGSDTSVYLVLGRVF